MGKGNVQIRYDGINYPTYYIKLDGEDEIDNQDAYLNLIEYLFHEPETKLEEVNKWINKEDKIIGKTNYCLVIFSNNEWSTAISIIPEYITNDRWNWDEEGINRDEYMDKYVEEANEIMNSLHNMYDIYCRTSAWTSTKMEYGSPFKFYK